jgi:hypothetical protein
MYTAPSLAIPSELSDVPYPVSEKQGKGALPVPVAATLPVAWAL